MDFLKILQILATLLVPDEIPPPVFTGLDIAVRVLLSKDKIGTLITEVQQVIDKKFDNMIDNYRNDYLLQLNNYQFVADENLNGEPCTCRNDVKINETTVSLTSIFDYIAGIGSLLLADDIIENILKSREIVSDPNETTESINIQEEDDIFKEEENLITTPKINLNTQEVTENLDEVTPSEDNVDNNGGPWLNDNPDSPNQQTTESASSISTNKDLISPTSSTTEGSDGLLVTNNLEKNVITDDSIVQNKGTPNIYDIIASKPKTILN